MFCSIYYAILEKLQIVLEILMKMMYNIITYIFFGEIIMEKDKIDRINALAKKAREGGLTDEEIVERDALRKEYLAAVRKNLRQQLDNIEIVDKGE